MVFEVPVVPRLRPSSAEVVGHRLYVATTVLERLVWMNASCVWPGVVLLLVGCETGFVVFGMRWDGKTVFGQGQDTWMGNRT